MLGPMPRDEDVTALLGAGYGTVLWEPGPEVIEHAQITRYQRWLAGDRGVATGSYTEAELAAAGAHAVLPDLTDAERVRAAVLDGSA